MEASYEILRNLVSSRLRLDILGSLDSPMRLCELRRAIGSNAPNTSSKAKELQNIGLIERSNGDYKITGMGRMVNERLSLLVDTIDVLYAYRDFWAVVLDKLPDEIRENLHKFKGARLVRNDRRKLNRVQLEILSQIKMAEGWLKVIMPAESEAILREARKASKRVPTKLVTLRDDPELGYGLILSDESAVLFTDVLDMALVKNPIRPFFVPREITS